MNKSFFKNKTVLITGASTGIGLGIAQELLGNVSTLIITSRNKESLNHLISQANVHKTACFAYNLNLENQIEVNEFTEQIIKNHSNIDILILNAGISQRSTFKETNIEVIRKIMEVNYFGNAIITQNLLPLLIKNKQSNIVIISSIVGKFGFYLRSAYSSSKHAILGLFETIRLENEKDGVNVNIIFPGIIKTDISKNALNGDGSTYSQKSVAHDEGMDVKLCSEKILKAIIKNKKETYIGRKEILLVYFKRFFPFLFYQLVKKQNPDKTQK